MREQADHVQLVLRCPQRLAGEQFKGQGLQTVTDQQGRRLVVFDMTGRTATAQHIVVHARQIVMYQRVGVNQFDRAGGDFQTRRWRGRKLARCEAQQGANALAAAQTGVAHGLMQAHRGGRFGWQEARERRFGTCLDVVHPVREGEGHGVSPCFGSKSRSTPFSNTWIRCSALLSNCWQCVRNSLPRR